MPEAAVNKDANAFLGKGEIGSSGQGQMPTPAFEARMSQGIRQNLLSAPVPFRPNARHEAGTLALSDGVSHSDSAKTHCMLLFPGRRKKRDLAPAPHAPTLGKPE